ncbi:hypothetical protein Tco_0121822 [Tanacetum coccineum]
MNEFGDSSFHNNPGRRMMTPEQEEVYPWDQRKSSDLDICKAFLKLCIVEDLIWDKISRKLKEPLRNTHVDECVCCQVQHITEENMHTLRMEMQEIHESINNDLKVLTMIIEDIAKVFFKFKMKNELKKINQLSNCLFGRSHGLKGNTFVGLGKTFKNFKDEDHPNLLKCPFPDESCELLKDHFINHEECFVESSNAKMLNHTSHPHQLIRFDTHSSLREKSVSLHDPMKRIQLLNSPDLFDKYYAGIVLMQMAILSLRSAAALGWDLATKLISERGSLCRGRLSAADALRHPYFLLGGDASVLSKLSFSK